MNAVDFLYYRLCIKPLDLLTTTGHELAPSLL